MTAARVPPVTPLRDDEPSAREPPANVEAEQRLLGAVLIDNRAFHRVAGLLRPGDFSYAVHGRIWAAIDRIIRDGAEANPVTLKTLFDQDKHLATLGGAEYLMTLASVMSLKYHYAERLAHVLPCRFCAGCLGPWPSRRSVEGCRCALPGR